MPFLRCGCNPLAPWLPPTPLSPSRCQRPTVHGVLVGIANSHKSHPSSTSCKLVSAFQTWYIPLTVVQNGKHHDLYICQTYLEGERRARRDEEGIGRRDVGQADGDGGVRDDEDDGTKGMGQGVLTVQADKTAAVNPMKELRIEKLVISAFIHLAKLSKRSHR